jgi:anti-sigma regulatory factor (Ser/Thr protein kinase)
VTGPARDDAASPPGEVHQLPFAAASNRTARGLLSRYLRGTGLDAALSQDAAIVLGELVANSLDHGRPDDGDGFEVTWRLDGGRLQLSVRDGGGSGTRPRVMAADPWATRGRGLAMVQALADTWWVDDASGTRVTAVLSVRVG